MGTQVRNFNCLIENPLAGVEYFYLDKKYQVVLSYLEIYSSLVKKAFDAGKREWTNSGLNSRLKCRNLVCKCVYFVENFSLGNFSHLVSQNARVFPMFFYPT